MHLKFSRSSNSKSVNVSVAVSVSDFSKVPGVSPTKLLQSLHLCN